MLYSLSPLLAVALTFEQVAGHVVARSATTSSTLATTSSVKNSGKRGLAYNDPSLTNYFSLAGQNSLVSWGYNWYFDEPNLSKLNPSIEFTPLLYNSNPSVTKPWAAAAQAGIDAGAEYLFSYNEPDIKYSGSNYMNISLAVSTWMQHMEPFAGKAKLVAPAVTNAGAPYGLTWLSWFIGNCTECTIDAINIHWYSNQYAGAAYLKSQTEAARVVADGRPIIISEFGLDDSSGGYTDTELLDFLGEVLPWLDAQDDVVRYAYFWDAPGFLINSAGTGLSDSGILYNNYTGDNSTSGPSCPDSNGTTYVDASSGLSYLIECNTDHYGGNLNVNMPPVYTLAECISACAGTTGCVDVSYYQGTCYMKGSVGKASTNTAVQGAKLITTGSSTSSSTATSSTSSTTAASASASASLCPNSNGTTYVDATSGLTYLIECGIDRYGGNLNVNMPSTSSLARCISACAGTAGCVDVSLYQGTCYMKGSAGKASANTAVQGAKLITASSTSSTTTSSTTPTTNSSSMGSISMTKSPSTSTSTSSLTSSVYSSASSSTNSTYLSASTTSLQPASSSLSSSYAGASSSSISTSLPSSSISSSSSSKTSSSSSFVSLSTSSSISSSASSSQLSTSATTPSSLSSSSSVSSTSALSTTSSSFSTLSTSTRLSSTTSSTAASTTTAAICPSMNQTTYTDVITGSKFFIECGIDHSAGNLNMVYVSNLAHCISACANTTSCVGSVLSGDACYMKSSIGKALLNKGVNGFRLLPSA